MSWPGSSTNMSGGNTNPLASALKKLVFAALGIAALTALALFLSDTPKVDQPLAMATQPGGAGSTLRLPAKGAASDTVYMPWTMTLINMERGPLTVQSWKVEEYANHAAHGPYAPPPADFNGGAVNLAGQPLPFPLTLNKGQITTFQIYLGFTPTREVAAVLQSMAASGSPVDVHQALAALAQKDMFLYGGKAVSQTITGGYTGDWRAPKYRVTFHTLGHQEATWVLGDFPRQ